MERLQLLKKISFGERVAEDETTGLAKYFVETDQWERILKGEVDVIRGEKPRFLIYNSLDRKFRSNARKIECHLSLLRFVSMPLAFCNKLIDRINIGEYVASRVVRCAVHEKNHCLRHAKSFD